MRLNKLLAGFLGLTLLIGVGTGCVVRARGGGHVAYVVESSPPPARASVYVGSRPGYTWVEGYWYWTGYDWAWQDGYWERHRPGYVYVQGVWVVSGGRHHWKPGHWRRGHDHGGGGGHWKHNSGGGYTYKPDNRGVKVREHGHQQGAGGAKVKVKVKEKPGKTTIKVREHR